MMFALKEMLDVDTNVSEEEKKLYINLKKTADDMVWHTWMFYFWAKWLFVQSWIVSIIRYIVGAISTVLGGGCLLYSNLIPTMNNFFVNGAMGADNMRQLNIVQNVRLPKDKLQFFVACVVIFVVTGFGWGTYHEDNSETLKFHQTAIVKLMSQHQKEMNGFLEDTNEVFDFVGKVGSADTPAKLFKVFANLKIQDDNQNPRFQTFYGNLTGGSACKGSVVVQALNNTQINYNLDSNHPLESSSRKVFYIVYKALRMYQRLDVIQRLCQVHRDRDSKVEDKTKIFKTNLNTLCANLDDYPKKFETTFVENVSKMLHWHILSKGQLNSDKFHEFLSRSKRARANEIRETATMVCRTAVLEHHKSSPNIIQRELAFLTKFD
jgi:hypothetical protein